MDKIINWGIIAPGRIAHNFCKAVEVVEGQRVLAAASRNQKRAEEFCSEEKVERAYGSYSHMLADSEIDAVYIASPHRFHADSIRESLEAGKHVLCEKPVTVNAEELKPLIDLAREKGLFFMEAMWSKFLPAWNYLKEDGLKEIGELKRIRADFSFGGDRDPEDRLLNIELAGGSILDMGVYVLSMALWMGEGMPEEVKSFGRIGVTGVDVQDSYLMRWKNGVEAILCTSLEVDGPCTAEICGTGGRIEVSRPFWGAESLEVVSRDGSKKVEFPHRANGFEYEIEEAGRCIAEGLTESPVHTHDDMLAMMELMDSCRKEWGFGYPFE